MLSCRGFFGALVALVASRLPLSVHPCDYSLARHLKRSPKIFEYVSDTMLLAHSANLNRLHVWDGTADVRYVWDAAHG